MLGGLCALKEGGQPQGRADLLWGSKGTAPALLLSPEPDLVHGKSHQAPQVPEEAPSLVTWGLALALVYMGLSSLAASLGSSSGLFSWGSCQPLRPVKCQVEIISLRVALKTCKPRLYRVHQVLQPMMQGHGLSFRGCIFSLESECASLVKGELCCSKAGNRPHLGSTGDCWYKSWGREDARTTPECQASSSSSPLLPPQPCPGSGCSPGKSSHRSGQPHCEERGDPASSGATGLGISHLKCRQKGGICGEDL